jgi:hypothetical protein
MASFSNDVKVTNFIFKNNEPMYSNTSWTGQRIMRSTGIQYYQIQFTLNFIKTSIPDTTIHRSILTRWIIHNVTWCIW